jgi:hypothetical protein
VDQLRAAQRVAGLLAAEEPVRQAAQLGMDQRRQFVDGGAVALAPFVEQAPVTSPDGMLTG